MAPFILGYCCETMMMRYSIRLAALAMAASISWPVMAKGSSAGPQEPRMVFQILVSELAIQEGELALAAATYVALAEETQQASIAERATQVALSARAPSQALRAARVWAKASNGQLEAQDTVDTLELMLGFTGDLTQSLLARREQARRAGQLEPFYERLTGLLTRTPNRAQALALLETIGAPDLEIASLSYTRAMLHEQLGRLDEMERLLRSLIAREPTHAHALNALGYSLADRGERLTEANELIRKAVNLAPEDPHILDSMGWVLFRMGQPKEALTWLERAHRQQPDAEISAHLGEVLWTLGQAERAKAIWRIGLARDPHNKVLAQTLERLGVRIE
ncbi:MAG: tetratricopeptide repeat protein [Burkholderiaceae bacterium]|jgi:Tfp pilus assembly protein PilF